MAVLLPVGELVGLGELLLPALEDMPVELA